jgi:hypothetical protein
VIEETLQALRFKKDEPLAEVALDVTAVAVERVLARRLAYVPVVTAHECAHLHDALLQQFARRLLSAAHPGLTAEPVERPSSFLKKDVVG